MLFYSLLLIVSVGGVFGSNIELNATLLEWFPPLYGLDDWASCQRPTDKYCIVDAALHSSQRSPLLDILQEYSSQALKHYNRTQIHRGVCVTRCGVNTTDVLVAAQACINKEVEKYELEAEVLSPQRCSTPGPRQASGSTRAFSIFIVGLLTLTIAATAVDFYDLKTGKKYLKAFSLISNWKILTHDRSKVRNEPRLNDLCNLEGIRVLAIEGVIFAHVILCFVYIYTDNPEYIEGMYDSFVWKILINSPVSLQAFFVITGFVMAYSLLLFTEKKDFSIGAGILSIIQRWIRLTPTTLFVIWFIMTWYPHMGSGPQWAWVVDREVEDCMGRWPYHLLHSFNYMPLGKFCMAHTWYIAVDFQLHIFGVVLMFVLLRFRRLVFPVLTTLLLGSVALIAFDVYTYNLAPIITGQSPETLRTLYRDSTLYKLIYLPMWMNLSGYVCGVATGFIHYYNQQKGVKLNEKKWFNIVNQLSLNLVNVVVFCGIPFLADKSPPLWASVIYASLDRTLVAVLFSLFVLGLINKCKSPILYICSWRGFNFLGRLSYCVYVIHFTILRLAIVYNTQLVHASLFAMVSLLIVGTVLSYVISIPLCLLIEMPSIRLFKALLSMGTSNGEPPKEKEDIEDAKGHNEA